jgi:hypothetical protein
MDRFADLDELITRCRAEGGRQHIREAVKCYWADAFRSAVVATWLAVVYDLVDKIRELAAQGSGEAKTLLDEFTNIQEALDNDDEGQVAKALEWERNILVKARERLKLFTDHQFRDLARLRDDRHKCAHPTFNKGETPFQPSPEQVRAHIRHAIEHLLSQPPVQGAEAVRAAIAVVGDDLFPTDPDKAMARLEPMLTRAPENVIRRIVDKLLEGFAKRGDRLSASERTLAALSAVMSMNQAAGEDQFRKTVNRLGLAVPAPDFELFAALVALHSPTWGHLHQPTRDRLDAFLGTADMATLLDLGPHLERIQDLVPRLKGRLGQLDQAGLAVAVRRGFGVSAVDAAVDKYAAAASWIGANELADTLVFPLFPHLTEAHVERILRAAASPREVGKPRVDLLGSGSFNRFLDNVSKAGPMPKEDLLALADELGLRRYIDAL